MGLASYVKAKGIVTFKNNLNKVDMGDCKMYISATYQSLRGMTCVYDLFETRVLTRCQVSLDKILERISTCPVMAERFVPALGRMKFGKFDGPETRPNLGLISECRSTVGARNEDMLADLDDRGWYMGRLLDKDTGEFFQLHICIHYDL